MKNFLFLISFFPFLTTFLYADCIGERCTISVEVAGSGIILIPSFEVLETDTIDEVKKKLLEDPNFRTKYPGAYIKGNTLLLYRGSEIKEPVGEYVGNEFRPELYAPGVPQTLTADVLEGVKPLAVSLFDANGKLFEAVYFADLEKAQLLIDKGADLESKRTSPEGGEDVTLLDSIRLSAKLNIS